MAVAAAVSGIGDAEAREGDSLEALIFRAATAALADAGLERDDLDGVVISASDQVDGRAISSMLTSGPAGAYLNEEINVASSPAHALALAYMQVLSGTHRRLLVSSWGKSSESPAGTAAAERLSADPFVERDGGMTALAATAMQALARREVAADRDRADAAAAHVAARNHSHGVAEPTVTAEDVLASPLVAFPLRSLEVPPETDGAFSFVVERTDRLDVGGVRLEGIGWSSDSARIAERDLVGVPHLRRAVADAFGRAGVAVDDISVWQLHDYSPDAELIAYAAIGLASDHEALDALVGNDAEGPLPPINPSGGSVRGEAPFGGPLRKVLSAVRQLRGDAGRAQVPAAERAAVQIASGFAGQFQSVFVLGREE